MQQRYSVTKIELLAIVEALKEFKDILWGQIIKDFTDHKNMIQVCPCVNLRLCLSVEVTP